jgi:putative intracellular protease/amidase
MVSSPAMRACQVSRLASAVGIAARQVAACRSPASVASRASMTRIAYLITSARELTLADGTQHPTGYFAEEALKPYERFVAAGFDVTVITPDGEPPYADPYGLSWFFHYPEEDKDYLASVVRTFAHDVDDIRITLHQNTELGLAAARRLAALLQAAGYTPAEAHRIVSAAARTAWRQDRQLADVLAEDGSHHLSREQIQAEVDAQRADSERLAAERLRRLQAIPGFQHPVGLHDKGADVLRAVLADLVRAFPDLMVTVSRVITTGDVVTALFKAEGTQAAGYAGAINQEKHLDIDQAWRFVVAGGLITEVAAYWCQAQLYRRLAVKRYDEIEVLA